MSKDPFQILADELTLIRKLRQEHDDPGSGSEPAAERAEAGE
mgnify:CR=1 FL=1